MTFSSPLLLLGCTSLAALVSVHAGALAPDADLATAAPRVEAVVSRVIDGSTLDAQIAGIRTPVGYLGAETAPLNRPCGREAFDRNFELAQGGVLLESDASYEVDDLSRRLYYAYTLDGTSIDETLIQEGLARAVRNDAAHGETLDALEAEAQAAGRGCLWAAAQ